MPYLVSREDYIAYSGIKGMKWGIRRFQNEDGTLTEAGKARYRDSYGKSLNALDQDAAKAMRDRALYEGKSKYALATEKQKKAEKYKGKQAEAETRLKEIEAKQWRAIHQAISDGRNVSMTKVNRYSSKNEQLVSGLIAGMPGVLAVSIRDVYRTSRYGAEAGGVVDGNVFSTSDSGEKSGKLTVKSRKF